MPARRPAIELPSEVEPFGILGILWLLVRAVLAYIAGFALYIGVFRVSREFAPTLRDPGLVNFAMFLLMIAVIAAIMLTFFQSMWSGEVRGLALMTSFTLVAIAVAQAAGLSHIDPAAPIDVLVRAHFGAFRTFGR
jgi:hypothetical protein